MAYNQKDERFFIPLKETKLTGKIAGPLAELKLEQVFSFGKDKCQETVEAVYNFPLPGDAAIDKVLMRFGKVRISTQLKERKQAEDDYREAKKKGKQAAILTKESPDVFALRIAGILPGQKVVVSTSFFVLGEQRGTDFEFRIPLTIAPRYSRKDEMNSPRSKGQPLASMIDPQHQFFMDLDMPAAGKLLCESFSTVEIDGRMLLERVVPDRDLLLRWVPDQLEESSAIVLDDGKKHFAVVVTPPVSPMKLQGREIILMLDRSGSMSGAKWEAATWAAERFLDSLLPDDRFNLCLFHDQPFWLDRHPVLATEENIVRAKEMLKRTDSGGTELGVALEQAMNQPSMDESLVKHVLVVTDAEVSDEDRIVHVVQESDRRCSVICIDTAPNSHLAREMAHAGHGVAVFLTSDPDEKDIASSLDQIMEMFASPVDGWVSVATDQPATDPSTGDYRKVENIYIAAEELLPKGRSVLFLGRFKGKRGSLLDVWSKGDAGGFKLPVNSITVPGKALSKLYWAMVMNRFEQVIGSERSPEETVRILAAMGIPVKMASSSKVYRENKQMEMRKSIRQALVELSLKHGVPCSETAFVAVRKEPGNKVTMVAPVPNALPGGWDERFAPMSNPGVLHSLKIPRADQNINYNIALSSMSIPEPVPIVPAKPKVLFDGVPALVNGKTVLFDSQRDGSDITGLLTALQVRTEGKFTGKIFLYVRDLSTPRITLDLGQMKDVELIRPINVDVHHGDRVVLELVSVQASPTKLLVTVR
ncbi:MAG: VIT domain-containing protein [Methanomassiliicoccales archaeon]